MLLEKLRHGVLEVATDRGPRYVRPSVVERVQLLWMFRNFHVLPQQVLGPHQKHLIDSMCREERFRQHKLNGHVPCVIGTVERLPILPGKNGNGKAA
jgi:hypothetical protein